MSASGDGVIDAPFHLKTSRPNALGPEIGSDFGGLRRVSVSFRAYSAVWLVQEKRTDTFWSVSHRPRPSQARGMAMQRSCSRTLSIKTRLPLKRYPAAANRQPAGRAGDGRATKVAVNRHGSMPKDRENSPRTGFACSSNKAPCHRQYRR